MRKLQPIGRVRIHDVAAGIVAAGVIVAVDLGAAPLTHERGAPARLVVPFYYGYKGVKWVEQIRLGAIPETGYWEQRGYDTDAWIGGRHG